MTRRPLAAKTYKRATRKEKTGAAASTHAAKIAQLQKHAPISAQFASNPRRPAGSAASTSRAEQQQLSDPMEQSVVEMKAQKLLLEAEKRATALQERQDGMADEDEVASRAKKTGAAGLKGKAAKPKKYEGASKGKNYMDIL